MGCVLRRRRLLVSQRGCSYSCSLSSCSPSPPFFGSGFAEWLNFFANGNDSAEFLTHKYFNAVVRYFTGWAKGGFIAVTPFNLYICVWWKNEIQWKTVKFLRSGYCEWYKLDNDAVLFGAYKIKCKSLFENLNNEYALSGKYVCYFCGVFFSRIDLNKNVNDHKQQFDYAYRKINVGILNLL